MLFISFITECSNNTSDIALIIRDIVSDRPMDISLICKYDAISIYKNVEHEYYWNNAPKYHKHQYISTIGYHIITHIPINIINRLCDTHVKIIDILLYLQPISNIHRNLIKKIILVFKYRLVDILESPIQCNHWTMTRLIYLSHTRNKYNQVIAICRRLSSYYLYNDKDLYRINMKFMITSAIIIYKCELGRLYQRIYDTKDQILIDHWNYVRDNKEYYKIEMMR